MRCCRSMNRRSFVLAPWLMIAACHGDDAAPPNAPETKPSASTPASASVDAAALSSVDASVDGQATPVAPVAAPAFGERCTGAALTAAVFGACRTRVRFRTENPASLRLTVSTEKVTVTRGQVGEITFTLTNTGTIPKVVDLTVPSSASPVSWMHGSERLDLLLEEPRIDLECISGSGPTKQELPARAVDLVQVELAVGGTLTWKRRVDSVRHDLVIDRAALNGFRGSGTPCKQVDAPLPTGVRHVIADSYVPGLAGVAIDVTVK
ncbi:hypothetical protein BH09MYX1_BH09MYX1_47390 [soil metagenome]